VRVDIDEVVAHAQSHIEQLNRNNRLQVSWDVEPGLPTIITDATKLEEIMQNLIGNAFKFTPRGRIHLRVRNIRELERVEFSIADTGIGIEARDRARIFVAFEQIKEAHTGDYNGVGLGLNIVKKYLDLMHGEIRVESEPGDGSTFIFSIPYTIPISA
jgi:signal transduction histidine kinase